jgi:hypothetical protein
MAGRISEKAKAFFKPLPEAGPLYKSGFVIRKALSGDKSGRKWVKKSASPAAGRKPPDPAKEVCEGTLESMRRLKSHRKERRREK